MDTQRLRTLRQQQKNLHPKGEPLDPDFRRLRYITVQPPISSSPSSDHGRKPKRSRPESRRTFPLQQLISNQKCHLKRSRIYPCRTGQGPVPSGYDIEARSRLGRTSDCDPSPHANPETRGKDRQVRPPRSSPTSSGTCGFDSDFSIVAQYGSEYRGFVQYYAFAQNRFWLNSSCAWVMELSMLQDAGWEAQDIARPDGQEVPVLDCRSRHPTPMLRSRRRNGSAKHRYLHDSEESTSSHNRPRSSMKLYSGDATRPRGATWSPASWPTYANSAGLMRRLRSTTSANSLTSSNPAEKSDPPGNRR